MSRTKSLVTIALGAALLCILGPLSIPLGPVPLSLCSLGIMLCACVLGPWRGMAAVGVYLCLGLLGLPVFSCFYAGLGKVLGPTGGYLLGYLACALVWGFSGRRAPGRLWLFAGLTAGTLLLYAVGTPWLAFSTGMGLGGALAAGVLPFLVGDALKILFVALLAPRLQKAVAKAGLMPVPRAKA